MAGKVVNSSLVFLSKFGAIRQESASKTATIHIRKTFIVKTNKCASQNETKWLEV